MMVEKEIKPRSLWGPERDIRDICAIVVHSTRSDISNHIGADHNSEEARRFFARGKSGPHFLIDTDGRILQLLPLDRVAWHLMINGESWKTYQNEKWRSTIWHSQEWRKADPDLYDWWDARWSAASPIDLWHPPLVYNNDSQYRSIGVSLVPQEDRSFSYNQTRSLMELAVHGLLTRLNFPNHAPSLMSRIMGHEDVHPLIRTSVVSKAGTDPGPDFDWSLFRGQVEESLQKLDLSPPTDIEWGDSVLE